MKKCCKCQKWMDISNFHKNKATKDGFQNMCKLCRSLYVSENRNKINKALHKWRLANKEKISEKRKKNKVYLNEVKKAWYRKNPDKKREQNKRYRADHPEQVYEYTHNRYARKQANGGKVTTKQWNALKAHYGYKCLSCGRQEPEIKLTADHVIPLKVGGKHIIENIQPLCRSCNSKKRANYIDFRKYYEQVTIL